MRKVRVYEFARELGLAHGDVLRAMAALGMPARNHMSTLDDDEARKLRAEVAAEKASRLLEERVRPTVVRRRGSPSRSLRAQGKERPSAPSRSGATAREPAPRRAATAPVRLVAPPASPPPGDARPPASAPPQGPHRPPRRPAPSRQPDAERRENRGNESTGAAVALPTLPGREPGLAEPQGLERSRPELTADEPAVRAEQAPVEPRGEERDAERAAVEPRPEKASREGDGEGPPARDTEPAPSQAARPPQQLQTSQGGAPPPSGAQPGTPPSRSARRRRRRRGAASAHVLPPPNPADYPDGRLPASVRLAHDQLPPGVVARGAQRAPAATPLSAAARERVIAEHEARRPHTRRRDIRKMNGTAPVGRPGRPGRKKSAPRGTKAQKTAITVPGAQKRVIRIEGQVQLQTLAQRMGMKANDLLLALMQLGVTGVHVNSGLDADTAKLLASDFGYEVENVARTDEELVEQARGTFEARPEDLVARPPIVTVMGHVDHGKTSLLDRIRSTEVAKGEAGGITQHIGAYRVETPHGEIVFLDTPGHEAFTSMRARGAQATDVVVLVVGADDGVMPQTKEAVDHARAAGVPIVVALNKIDRPEARPDAVLGELAKLGLQSEAWGGETLVIRTSAITGEGVDALLQAVLLQAEMLELRANPKIPAEGIVLEAYLDRGRGPVANVLVRDGTLRTGEYAVAGVAWGRVRAMTDERGQQRSEAGPATPVEVLGLSEVPQAGDRLHVVETQRKAQEVAAARQSTTGPVVPRKSVTELKKLMASEEVRDLKVILKGDMQGSVEALQKAVDDLGTDEVRVEVVHAGVGAVTEKDVMLASASHALLLAFHVRPQGSATKLAKQEGVEIRNYEVIYDVLQDVRKAMTGLLEPVQVEEDVGRAEVRQVFRVPGGGAVAGAYVTAGRIARSGRARILRKGEKLWEGPIASLRRFKDDVREVTAGHECGIRLDGYNEVNENDVIECYTVREVAPELA